MSDKCFCHLNGYEVKDAKARASLITTESDITDFKDKTNSAITDINIKITNNDAETKTEIANLNARMNSFTSLPEGSTSGDAELIDIRTGLDGVTYESAGDSIRANDNKLQEQIDGKFNLIDETQNRNMFDHTKTTPGWLVDGGGTYNQATWVTSDFIPITNNLAYCSCIWNGTSVMYNKPRKLCLYDENKNFITGSYVENATQLGTFTTDGASFVRISVSILNDHDKTVMFLLGDTRIDNITSYIPYGITKTYKISENVKLRPERKIIAVGDSITYGSKQAGYDDMVDGVSYMTNACKRLGFELDNYSISASTLGLESDGTDTHQALIERFTEMDDEADLVYVAMGTNDWYYHYELGVMSDRVKTTFYGALHLLCQGLKDKYPNTPIVFATPIKRWIIRAGENNLPGNLNYDGLDLNLWRNAIKEVCEYHSIPVVDMYAESYLNACEETERNNYIPDGTHPNGAGHKKMQITCESILNKYLDGYYI